jgi:hypothetical protein
VVTCAAGCTCAKKCYAAKLCRIYPSVKKAYNNNLECYNTEPREYFNQVKKAAESQRFFRWHVAGDIPDKWYFVQMLMLAYELPDTRFLCFTKKYDIINDYISSNGKIPENIRFIFSEWDGMHLDNPHNIPTSQVIFRGESEPDDCYICTGNCLECAVNGVGCWTLKNGESVAFHEH